LQKLLADHHFRGRQVVSCLGSQELFVQNVRLPQLPAQEVEKVVHWEAEERLPYPVAEAEIRHLVAGEVRQDTNVKQEVILLACQRNSIQRHINVLEAAGLAPVAIDIEPLAVVRNFQTAGTDEASSRRALLNFGEDATTVILTEGDKILFLKYISSGGHHLDQAVAKHLGLGLAEAASMRATVTASPELDPDNDIHRSIVDAIRITLDGMATEIELCLRYYKVTFRGKPLERIIVTGSEASKWLADYLSERLGLSCALGNPFASLSRWPTLPAALERPWRWATAMGLSLR
jgi:type IV pilus assembly protein PilM